MPAALDHLVITVPDLEEAVADFARTTGVEPVAGGSHVGMGTRNALVGLTWRGRDRAYLELLGPDPAQEQPPAERTMLGAGAVWQQGRRLHGWAVEVGGESLDAAVRRGRDAGLDVGEPVATERRRADGTLLSWRLAAPYPLGLGGLQPFLIDWQGGAHPCDAGLPSLELIGLRLRHPDPGRVRAVLTTLGVEHEVGPGEAPGLTALVAAPRGELELR